MNEISVGKINTRIQEAVGSDDKAVAAAAAVAATQDEFRGV